MISQTKEILSNCYNIKIKTVKLNEMNLYITIKNDKLFITCFYSKNYFKRTFSNSFTLPELQNQSDYYKQFKNIERVINEIAHNIFKEKEYIKEDEESSKEIELIIPLSGTEHNNISFKLQLEEKSEKEEYQECKSIVAKYEEELLIADFNSKILISKDIEKHAIKMFISPNHKIKAKLIYSFHKDITLDKKGKITFNDDKVETVEDFHSACDKKKHILILCKSKEEIFGGYTPLAFSSSNEYGRDNESFLFSLNRFKKYPKNSFKNTESIWCYKNFGPCFHYDLSFHKKEMNIVELKKTNYLTSDNWINKNDCYTACGRIILDSLEIFQIVEEVYNSYKINKINDDEEQQNIDGFSKDKIINKDLNNIIISSNINNIINNETNNKNHNINENNEININSINTNNEKKINEKIKVDFTSNYFGKNNKKVKNKNKSEDNEENFKILKSEGGSQNSYIYGQEAKLHNIEEKKKTFNYSSSDENESKKEIKINYDSEGKEEKESEDNEDIQSKSSYTNFFK